MREVWLINGYGQILSSSSSPSRASPDLERRGFHEVLPMFSILSVFPCWVEPRLRGWRSASRVHSQVWRGRPGGRLQSLGSFLMETKSSRDVKWRIHPCHVSSDLDELTQLGRWTSLESYRGVGYVVMLHIKHIIPTAPPHTVRLRLPTSWCPLHVTVCRKDSRIMDTVPSVAAWV